ncbi:TIGR03986 family CRISPR-associated RAMP protein [Nostoc sp. XA010]|uniref:TIGR03986 family type III CRISPR-associated RAMP protein n=1 Tax=Nostoc sp. XA010 TaxID=2780407 RepID=UPI001E2C5B31|nr:TIGR03986 family CRISPR-associated RAMP protein [Nostoc sp. XA010]MCC5660358.1 TIGR03986 family CRISPR-associated RAMP protein [Nostoc sp. XA010]
MSPKHIHDVPENRKAVAPYNFVELPDTVVQAELEENGKLRNNDLYYQDRHTGRIECTLTTSSPLYIRCGLTLEQFKFVQKQLREGKKYTDYPDFFYNPVTNKPEIAGSSLRGMFRTLIEIISFSKIGKVSDAQKFFFRAVAAEKDDPLRYQYKLEKLKAGYLEEEAGKWYIRSVIEVNDSKNSYFEVKERDIQIYMPSLITMDKEKYLPQYIEITFDIKNNPIQVSERDIYQFKGWLVTSGNMLETANLGEVQRKAKLRSKEGRKYHYIVPEVDNSADAHRFEICADAITDYKLSLTDYQKGKLFKENKKNQFHPDNGILKVGIPVFYCEPLKEQPVKLFGQSPNFRIPFYPKGHRKAADAIDFIPENLRESSIIDIADAIFGFVKQEKQPKDVEQSRAGRVFITNAQCKANNNHIWLESHPIIPKILTNPKPTTFQHYLVQPDEINAEKKHLKHYASEPIKDTVIRGHKLYWHKGSNPEIKHPNPDEASDTQLTQLKPIKPEVNFEFTIHFENLSSVELGALMWVIDIAQDNKYRLSLGMGKPLGMGAVKVTHELYLSQRKDRYTKLFDDSSWHIPETVEKSSKYKDDFEEYILSQLTQGGIYEKVRKFTQIPRIQMLLAMLTWEENPSSDYLEQTRYMEIERKKAPCIGNDPNEYKERRVLPTPLKVIKEILPSEELTEGQVVEGTVIKIDRQQVPDGKKTKLKTTITYEIQGSDCPSKEEVNKQEVSLTIGDMVKVKIERCQGTSVRKVKRV